MDMDTLDLYEMASSERENAINQLVSGLPSDDHPEAIKTINEICDLFPKHDVLTIGVLGTAVEKGVFNDYVFRLKNYHETKGFYESVKKEVKSNNENLVEIRSMLESMEQYRNRHNMKTDYLHSVKMQLFFLDCHELLNQ